MPPLRENGNETSSYNSSIQILDNHEECPLYNFLDPQLVPYGLPHFYKASLADDLSTQFFGVATFPLTLRFEFSTR